ncbi:oxidoreductase, partial [Burkholderia pseudomallei]
MHDRPDLARPDVVLSLVDVRALALRVLAHHGLSVAHARAIAIVFRQGQRVESHSH